MSERWHAVVLAASRGPDDPMAKAYGVLHKCRIEIGGVPMIQRVVAALQESGQFASISISCESQEVYDGLPASASIEHSPPQNSAPSSALKAIREKARYPVLITTGDHALLTAAMVRYMCNASQNLGADFAVGLARADIIQAAYPQTRRTYFRFGPDRVSGCNLFTVHNERGLRVLERWQHLERNRKQPWKLVFAFGVTPLLKFLTGRLTMAQAFEEVSTRIGATVRPINLPYAEAAIDVDKPSDKELAEEIIQMRSERGGT
jgi:GTP:adenosylcobinamide-phosphate guanylyltransferase